MLSITVRSPLQEEYMQPSLLPTIDVISAIVLFHMKLPGEFSRRIPLVLFIILLWEKLLDGESNKSAACAQSVMLQFLMTMSEMPSAPIPQPVPARLR